MLVLTRKIGEKILIGKDIVIEVLEIRRHEAKVRLGITAPQEVPIMREEVLHGDEPVGDMMPGLNL